MITFAIPFYSNIFLLNRAIESVLNQSKPEWLLIIVDDSGSLQISAQVEKLVLNLKDSRIRYFSNPKNLGMAANWNRCLELAETSWVTLLHSDDELNPLYIEQMNQLIKDYPEAVALFCGADIIGESSPGLSIQEEPSQKIFSFPDYYKRFLVPQHSSVLILEGENALVSLLHGQYIMCPTLCFQKAQLKSRQFSLNWKMVLDFEFITRLILDGEKIVGIPRQKLYRYRRHSSNATVIYTENLLRFEEEIQIFDILEKKTKDKKWLIAAKLAHQKRIIILNLGFCLLTSILKRKWKLCPLYFKKLILLLRGNNFHSK